MEGLVFLVFGYACWWGILLLLGGGILSRARTNGRLHAAIALGAACAGAMLYFGYVSFGTWNILAGTGADFVLPGFLGAPVAFCRVYGCFQGQGSVCRPGQKKRGPTIPPDYGDA